MLKFHLKQRHMAFCSFFFCAVFSLSFLLNPISSFAKESSGFHSDAPTALLMEASTGTILYEKEADTERPPASVTKVMTLLLIFDALAAGQLSLDDTITVSEYAASMGGSQVFLEPGETQTAETMIKCIAVSSANDACVAMAEHIAGSEETFVAKMNERAANLGMKHTHFANCCGLDADGHYTSSRDIALMSRELTIRYPQVFHYTTIWMENITHVTRRGASEFGLSNTNKLIRQYNGATGLKTGSTSKAGFCLSATATRNGVSLIAVVMGCDSSKARISACSALLDYGFSICQIYKDENPPVPPVIPVTGGKKKTVSGTYPSVFSHVSAGKLEKGKIKKKIQTETKISAPVKKGQQIGSLIYYYNGKEIGTIPIVAKENIEKAHYIDHIRNLFHSL
ncbi:MAG: D-alanyl-D-alanine carboxypeptidase [Eubacterium sp.]|nr:D-alanyl-D-alanine carboxypeptidase [Eubacterium sp.]